MRNNADSYSSEEEDENIADRGSRQEVEEDDVEAYIGDDVAKGYDVEEGVRVDTQVNMNDLEEDASLRVVFVVEETDMMEGASGVGASREEGPVRRLCKGVSNKGGARKQGSGRVDDEVVTSGFIRSTSGKSITESANGVGQSNFEFRRVSNNQSISESVIGEEQPNSVNRRVNTTIEGKWGVGEVKLTEFSVLGVWVLNNSCNEDTILEC
ncbi:hypothetical protein CsSME_00011796 [Camellia sinensis var. sinensis]